METDELTELARRLVSIPSHEDAEAAGDAIEEWLREETNAAVTRDDAGNVIARKGEGASVALVGHHDVVPPADRQTEDGEYEVHVEDDRLYGRGAADMKGAVAAMLLAFRDADPKEELIFASFVGEEAGGLGVRFAIDDGFAPDYAVVGEGSTGYSSPEVTDVAIAHKGRRGSSIVASGRSAHASEPEAGENAIYRACDAVDVVRDLDAPSAEVFGEEVTGSVAATQVDGGTAWNVIPDECQVVVDERTVPGDRADLAQVEEITGVTWEVDQDLPPMECGDEGFANTVLDAAKHAQNGVPEHVVKPHATDAGWLSEEGTECVICGPSEPGEAHTEDESVSLDVLQRCYRIYREVGSEWPVQQG